jgi:hypothetical protein
MSIRTIRPQLGLALLCVAGAGLLCCSHSTKQSRAITHQASGPASIMSKTKGEAPAFVRPVAHSNGSYWERSCEDLSAMEQQTDELLKEEMLEAWTKQIAGTEIPSALGALQGLPPTDLTHELSIRLARRWAEEAPALAADWTSSLPEGATRQAVMSQLAIAWANQDPAAALVWVQALPEGDSKESASFSLAYETARTDPVTALDLSGQLSPSRQRDDLLVFALRQWTTMDAVAAQTWAMNIADQNLEQRLVAAVAVASAKQDGAGAAALAATALRPGDEQNRAVVSVAEQWAQTSPDNAAAWVSDFPESATRNAAMLGLQTLQGGAETPIR